MSRGPLLLGDMGHSLFRLSRARATARTVGFDVKEVLYPGFEGRPDAVDLEDFFTQVERQVDIYRLSHGKPLVVGSGFGALVLLGLRARGKVRDLPSVVQGAIPWATVRDRGRGSAARGEAERLMYADRGFQGEYALQHLHSPYDADELSAFFAGFATCTAFPRVHEWFDADWLERLESDLARRPSAIDGIRVWMCGEDEVVDPEEHEAATRALGADWPTSWADRWGHYPYLDAPGPWIGALQTVGV